MATVNHYKLVRDNIPKIIEKNGQTAECERLGKPEMLEQLDRKLLEEVLEYLNSGEPEELADIQEVINALLQWKGISQEDFERLRLQKKKRNGGFEKGIFLLRVHAD